MRNFGLKTNEGLKVPLPDPPQPPAAAEFEGPKLAGPDPANDGLPSDLQFGASVFNRKDFTHSTLSLIVH